MSRVIYWIREIITNEKNCRGFCPSCRHYKICKLDEGADVQGGRDPGDSDTVTIVWNIE